MEFYHNPLWLPLYSNFGSYNTGNMSKDSSGAQILIFSRLANILRGKNIFKCQTCFSGTQLSSPRSWLRKQFLGLFSRRIVPNSGPIIIKNRSLYLISRKSLGSRFYSLQHNPSRIETQNFKLLAWGHTAVSGRAMTHTMSLDIYFVCFSLNLTYSHNTFGAHSFT